MTIHQAAAIAAQQYDMHADHCDDCPPRLWDRPPSACWRGLRLHLTWSVRQRAVWLALTERGVHS